jgi:hypothetical protein
VLKVPAPVSWCASEGWGPSLADSVPIGSLALSTVIGVLVVCQILFLSLLSVAFGGRGCSHPFYR